MDTKKLIYRNGHFYDSSRKERVSFQDGTEYVIVASGDSITAANPAGNKKEPISSKALEKELAGKIASQEYSSVTKILPKGSFTYFKLNPIKAGEGIVGPLIFQVELFEDLYAYLLRKGKRQEPRLYECACAVIGLKSGKIDFFEKVYGESMNDVFKCTFVHYFGNMGHATGNALDRIHTKADLDNSPTLKDLIKNQDTDIKLDLFGRP
jgi:hypothetical protein